MVLAAPMPSGVEHTAAAAAGVPIVPPFGEPTANVR